MKTTLLILMAFGLYVLFCYYKGRNYGKGETAEEVSEELSVNEEKPAGCPTRVLVMQTLRRMGCEPVAEEDSTTICFDYQGERILIVSSNDCLFIDVYDLWWYRLSMDADIEEFARMQKAVNLINGWANCTVLYTMNKEDRLIGVHLRRNILFIEQIPNLELYLKSVLEDFFMTQREMLKEMEKAEVREQL
ncbi:MAG: hypothetical protein J6Z14_11155 [Prevotella sp.]|nr:hypothetical protein [Prevotella sp.]